MAIATTIGAAAILSLVAPAFAAEEFDPQFYSNTWGGLCATGKLQTPIDLPARFDELPPVPENLVTTVRMPLVKNPEIVNKGSAIQVRLRAAVQHSSACPQRTKHVAVLPLRSPGSPQPLL